MKKIITSTKTSKTKKKSSLFITKTPIRTKTSASYGISKTVGKIIFSLIPVDPSDDIAEDEVLICEYGETKNGEEFVNPVDDEKELERIYNLYVKEYEEAAKDE